MLLAESLRSDQANHPSSRRQPGESHPILTLGASAAGLLADAVGLGKTLTMLAAIVHSLDAASRFSLSPPPKQSHDDPAIRTRATLIVVPSARK